MLFNKKPKAKGLLDSIEDEFAREDDVKIYKSHIMVSENDLPTVSNAVQKDERDSHLERLSELASNFESDEAMTTLEVLTEKYPLLAAAAIGNSLSRKNSVIASIKKEAR